MKIKPQRPQKDGERECRGAGEFPETVVARHCDSNPKQSPMAWLLLYSQPTDQSYFTTKEYNEKDIIKPQRAQSTQRKKYHCVICGFYSIYKYSSTFTKKVI